MNVLRTTTVVASALAVLLGGMAPAATANESITNSNCWSWTNDAGQPYHLECSWVSSLDQLNIPDTVTYLRLSPTDEKVISGLSGLSDHPNLETLDIYGSSAEAVAAAAQLPNLRTLTLDFPEGSSVPASSLAELKKLTSLSISNTGIRDFSWVSSLTSLETFYTNDTSVAPLKATVGRAFTFEPIIGVDGEKIIPKVQEDRGVPLETFHKITATTAVPLKYGSQALRFSTLRTPSSLPQLTSASIDYDLLVDNYDTPTFTPLEARADQIAAVGQTLSVPWGQYGTHGFQWKRNGTNIVGATGREYKLVTADAGQLISVTYSTVPMKSWDQKITFVPSATTTTVYDAPVPASPAKSPMPQVSGTGYITEILKVSLDAKVFPTAKRTYQWYSDEMPIKGATGSSFTPGPNHNLRRISAAVTIVGAQAQPIRLVSTEIKVQRGALKASKPTITGTAHVGLKLTANAGTVNKSGTKLLYIWQRNGKDIFQQYGRTYTLTPADLGQKISVKAQYTLEHYDSTAPQSTSKTVAPGTLKIATKPIVTGKKAVGKTVKVTAGKYAPGPVTVKYQWLRAGKNIKGATKGSYMVVKADVGKKVTVRVAASKKGYTTRASTLTVK